MQIAGLGRRVPPTDEHIQKYPLRAIQAQTIATVNKRFALPYYHWEYNQGDKPYCVGYSLTKLMSFYNYNQARAARLKPYVHRYNPDWLYHEAQKVDEWPGEDYDGTSVNGGCKVLRDLGHQPVVKGHPLDADISQGIQAYRWAKTVDEIRTGISTGNISVIGINWYRNFSKPVYKDGRWWITEDINNIGPIDGGHAICLTGALDNLQAVELSNTWGKPEYSPDGKLISGYPNVLVPYKLLERLMNEDGESVFVTDR